MATFSKFTSYPTFSGVTKDKAVSASSNNTDVVYQDIQLFIEGVQVPFESISVNQVYGGMPTADIQIPPESGLMDITRGYEPKVHIFYKDDNYGGHRLLFWGVIKSSSYSRSRSQGNTFIAFHCEHKNSVLNQITLDYVGWANQGSESYINDNLSNSIAKPNSLNSTFMVIEALTGISGVATDDEALKVGNVKIDSAPTDKASKELEKFVNRYYGMPGVALNFWNQLKKGAAVQQFDHVALNSMYIPLVEEGISFFKRFSGHPALETKLQNSKEAYCHTQGSKEKQILVPPCFRSSMASAVQRDLAVRNISNAIGFSGELTSYYQIISEFFSYCKYDLTTLASPAEINSDHTVYIDEVNVAGVEKMAIETIAKPQIPFYYSPICNVLLPRMYSSVQVNQDEGSTPTRIAALHDSMPASGTSGGINLTFNAPQSVREAIAYNYLLKNSTVTGDLNIGATTSYTYHIPGKYEQGTGVRPTRVSLPWWLVMIASDKEIEGRGAGQEAFPEKGTEEYNNMMILTKEWRSRYANKVTQQDDVITVLYDPTKNGLNQNDPASKVLPYQRILFSTIDYEFSEKAASSRTGSVEAVFNPYIIPGYPMDVIDDSPNHPSFHGYCTSVTHSITSRSIVTNVSMVAVTTYAELSNFYTPSLSPFLQSSMEMVNAEIDDALYESSPVFDTSPFSNTASTILQNPKAKRFADDFYRQVLGVGAAGPDDLIHFSSGRAYPLYRKGGILIPKMLSGTQAAPDLKPHSHAIDGREKDDYYSVVGNLRLVARPIESKESISTKFRYNFIPLDPNLYNSSFVNYVNPILANNILLEPGASLFLDYMDTDEFIKASKPN
jgi:hypothetical protein